MADGLFPAWWSNRIRARSTSRTGAAREERKASRFCFSVSVRTKAGSFDFPAMLHAACPILPILYDEIDTIFGKTCRGREAIRHRIQGTGTGLYLSKQIMLNQRGDLILW